MDTSVTLNETHTGIVGWTWERCNMEEVEPSLLYNHNSAGVTIVYTSINVENCGVSLSEQHRAASFDQLRFHQLAVLLSGYSLQVMHVCS